MDDEKLKQLLTPPSPSEPDEETLRLESEFWQALVDDLNNEDLHKQYVGHILAKYERRLYLVFHKYFYPGCKSR